MLYKHGSLKLRDGWLPLDQDEKAWEEELRRDLRVIAVDIGERNLQRCPAAYHRTADFLEAELEKVGLDVRRETFQSRGQQVCNIVSDIPGRGDGVVIVGAHYDSVENCAAANDNGSAMAMALGIARRLKDHRGERTLRIVFFANEEAPYFHTEEMGSIVHAEGCRQRNESIAAMICLETVGFYTQDPGSQDYPPLLRYFYPNRGDFLAIVGNTASAGLVKDFSKSMKDHGRFPFQTGALPMTFWDICRSDQLGFWERGFPALMLTDTANFRYKHYHLPSDTIDKITFAPFAQAARAVEIAVTALLNPR
ncbi:MAG: M28 family peptidase [Candidatus Sumerlaeia bacterium]|nr:M28 family peptidase [Candidatus Sumerlaeia bacterium]